MMWNYLVVSGLLLGARLVLFDGDPNHAGPGTLWQLAADEGVTWFGVGSPFITASRRSGIAPGEQYDLSALRAVGATGAPFPPSEGFRWIYEAVSPDVMLSPISGGTDVCSAFVGGSPMTPVPEGADPVPLSRCRRQGVRRGRSLRGGGEIRLMMRKGCSTLARTLDLILFFARSASLTASWYR